MAAIAGPAVAAMQRERSASMTWRADVDDNTAARARLAWLMMSCTAGPNG